MDLLQESNEEGQGVNNNWPEGVELRVRRMIFTPFVIGDYNAIRIVNTYTHINLSKLL